ncbi:MAG: glycosyltransferase family 39 protein [Acidobacteriota bacterium]
MATETADNRGTSTTAAIIFAMWAAVLVIAFLAYRVSDAGQLPQLLGNIAGGPLLGGEGLRDSLTGAVAAGLIGISWFGLGGFLFRFIETEKGENHSHVLELAMRVAAGSAIWSLIWFFLGAAGAYGKAAAVVALLIGLVLAVLSFGRVKEATAESRVPETANAIDKVLLILAALPVGLAFIASLAPPIAKDTLLYHFAVPKAFIAQGSSAFIEGNIASFLALGTEMHVVWAMLLGQLVSNRAGEAAAGTTLFLFFPILLLAAFGFARELNISRRGSLIAVLVTAAIPTAFYVASSGYIDLAMALYVLLASYALCRWWQTLGRGWLVLIGIFLGAALAAKLTAVFVIAAFALVILLRARKDQDAAAKIIAGGAAALVLAGLLASPWYLRTWAATGSPVFPFYMSIWNGSATGWDVDRSNLFQAMNSQYGGDAKNALDYIAAPISTAIIAQPEKAAYFDGVIGVAFLMGLPLLIWGLWKFELPVEIKIVTGIAGISFLFWLFSSQQLRYLLPVLPVIAIANIAAAERVSTAASAFRKWIVAGFAAAAVAGILVSAAWFLQRSPVRVVLGGETRDAYLSRHLDYYPYYQVLTSEAPADAKVWLINMRRDTYNIERPYFSDYIFEDWTLRQMVWDSRNVEELRAKTAAMGIQYILARHDVLLDYGKSVLVDDKKPRAENEARLKMARDLIADPARTARSDKRFSLVKVF